MQFYLYGNFLLLLFLYIFLKLEAKSPNIHNFTLTITCAGGCGSLESFSHLFLHCNVFGDAWHLIHCWLGIFSVLPSVPADYLIQFGFVGDNCSKVQQSIMHLIWYAIAWEI